MSLPREATRRASPAMAGILPSAFTGFTYLEKARGLDYAWGEGDWSGQMNVEPIAEAYPPSPMQEGMLFHSLSARQPGVDIEQILCTLREAIDSAVFARAWQHMVERHAILRTSFRWDGLDAPQQEVHSRVRLHFENKAWRGLSKNDQQPRFEACLQPERARGFDLTV